MKLRKFLINWATPYSFGKADITAPSEEAMEKLLYGRLWHSKPEGVETIHPVKYTVLLILC